MRIQEPGDDEITIEEGISYSQELCANHMQIDSNKRHEIEELLRVAGRDIFSKYSDSLMS